MEEVNKYKIIHYFHQYVLNIVELIKHLSIVNMYLSVTENKHVFLKPQPSKLISMIPLCAKTIILFCEDHSFYHYSLLQQKLLYQSNLPGRPIKIIAISDHEIVCTIAQKRTLILLNIRFQSLTEICKLPQSMLYNEGRQKQVFTQICLYCFQETNSFYIEQGRPEENMTKICYLQKQKPNSTISKADFLTRDFDTKHEKIRKIDSHSLIGLYRQTPQQNGIFKFKSFDCSGNFNETSYTLEHKSFTVFSVVREVRKITKTKGQEKYLLFVNSQLSQILIFNEQEVKDYNYRPNKVFLMTILLNIRLDYGIFLFMSDPTEKESQEENVLEIVNLETGKVINSHKCTVNDIVKSWEDDYFIYFKSETKAKSQTNFTTSHILGKKYLYMKMLEEFEGAKEISPNFMQQISNLL